MRQLKNPTIVLLMVSSIVLLLVFQFFWLRGSYREASDDFQKETNLIFRNTVFAMHDSMIQQRLEPLSNAPPFKYGKQKGFWHADSVVFSEMPPDSVINHVTIREKTARIEIMSSSHVKGDSLGRILRPLVTQMHMAKEPKTFLLRLGGDSLNVDSIQVQYRAALEKAGIDASFEVTGSTDQSLPGAMRHQVKTSRKRNGEFRSEVRLTPVNQYAVSFTGIQGILIRKITPQILFSAFLTLLTIASFYVMYRNLKSQQRLMRIKNDFISNVTHELKTPVATVSVALEALRNFNALEDPKRTSEYLEIAQNELNRLTLMTDKILKTAVYEDQGVDDLSVASIDLDQLIQQVLSSMKLVFEKRNAKVSYEKDGTSFVLQGSQAHLTNVIYNLVDNALKYSGDEPQLKIRLQASGNTISLSIEDRGIGIASEYQQKIFEKFFRVPSGDVHNTKGYGLGLSYVSSVIKSHGGEIGVRSEPGAGSVFTIELPVAFYGQ